MALDAAIRGVTSGTGAEVAGTNQLKIIPENNTNNNPNNLGGVRVYAENDQGLAAPYGTVNVPNLTSYEADLDYRMRVANDSLLDEEQISYSAQNFTKHGMWATTFVPTWTTAGYATQATTPITTAAAASQFRTYKTFSMQGTETLSVDMEIAFTYATGAALASPIVIEGGFGLSATSTPYDQFDGAYWRLSSAGMYLVMRNNNSSDSAVVGPLIAPDQSGTNVWQPISGRKYQIILYLTPRTIQLWINDPSTNVVWLAGTLNASVGLGSPVASANQCVFLRQYQVTAPAVGSYATLSRYSVRRGGAIAANSLADIASRTVESILSQGTLTTTSANTVTTGSVTRPSAAVLLNTAALATGLSALALETATLAVGTDGILLAYQNPALPTTTGTTYAQARRLRIDGVRIGTSVQTAFTAGGFVKHFYIAYGSTSVSLAGVATDTVTTKAYRRVMLEFTQAYTATQAAGTLPAAVGSSYMVLKNPVYVNPGEYVALCSYHIGTAGTAGVLQHNMAFDYAWE